MDEKDQKQNRLEGRVAQILNARELVINIGENQGVTAEMKFAILSESPMEVLDPNSGELLDHIDREKVRVEATEVREKISICKTYKIKIISGGPLYAGTITNITTITGAFRPPTQIPETLAAKDADLPPPLSPEESYVKINDRVIQVKE